MTRVLIPGEHFGLPASETTMGEALQERGYRTACIGKWHLGNRPPYRPNRHGFDYFYGLHYSNDMTLPLVHWPSIKLFRNEEVIEAPVKQPPLTRAFTSEASRFISDNKDRPFLLYLPYTMPHLPWSASSDFAGKSNYGGYGDAVEEIDWSVGEILKTVSDNGLDEDTIIMFLSDNGPDLVTPEPGGSAGALKGGKGSTWEGGVRVPCVVRWPGHVPGGAVLPGITCIMDLYATVLELAGADVPPEYVVDGQSLIPYLEGKAASPRSAYYYYRGRTLCAVRSENWKLHLMKTQVGKKGGSKDLVVCHPPELYNLDTDPGENENVQSEHQEIAAKLAKLAREFEASFVPGRRPSPQWRSVLPRMPGRKKKHN
jgi:arylsulfatase A-like enzyme